MRQKYADIRWKKRRKKIRKKKIGNEMAWPDKHGIRCSITRGLIKRRNGQTDGHSRQTLLQRCSVATGKRKAKKEK